MDTLDFLLILGVFTQNCITALVFTLAVLWGRRNWKILFKSRIYVMKSIERFLTC
ncbi:hypothetical protein PspTeo4_11256 [Pseudomonas sp. Teo4]|nr:hypothetical protein [Pseudomonas sp. Teo4]